MSDSTDDWEPTYPWEPFIYRAHMGRSFGADGPPVIDGDTIWFRMDRGFHDYFISPVRLMTVDTREISFVAHDSEEYKRGKVHQSFTRDWLERGRDAHDGDWPFLLKTYLGEQEGKYGRVLAEVWARDLGDDDERSLADALLEEFDDVEVYD